MCGLFITISVLEGILEGMGWTAPTGLYCEAGGGDPIGCSLYGWCLHLLLDSVATP